MLVKTLMDTAHTAPTYVSQTLWQYEKEGGDGVRAATVKVVRHAKRLVNNADDILNHLLAEKVMQKYHKEVQEYVREKEPKDAFEAADLVVRYFKLKGIDEHKYEVKKPWTHKVKEEKLDKPHSRWSSHHHSYKTSFKQSPQDTHQVKEAETPDQTPESAKLKSDSFNLKHRRSGICISA